jgi:integrase
MWTGTVEIPSTDGKRRTKRVYSKNRNEAARKLRELRAEIAAGRVPTTSTTTVGKWLDYWLENVAKPELRPTTYRSYEQVLRLHVKPHIGGIRMNKLTAEDIRRMKIATQEKSRRFAQLAYAVLNTSFKQALVEGILPTNPLDAVKPPRYTPTERSSFDTKTATHILKIAFGSRDAMEGCAWAIMFLTGCRRGELLGLEWNRVDLDEGFIDLGWQLQRLQKDWKPEAGEEARQITGTLWWTKPKSKAGTRVVPLVGPLLAALIRLKGLDTGPNPHELVFHFADGRPWTPEDFFDMWKALLADADVRPVPLHSIRHTTATLLQASGVPEDMRQLILGHNSAAVTRGYVHVAREQKLAALGNLSALMPLE